MNRDLLVPCVNPACEYLTSVRVYGATRDDPSYESTDCCGECGDQLDFTEAEYDEPDYEAIYEGRREADADDRADAFDAAHYHYPEEGA